MRVFNEDGKTIFSRLSQFLKDDFPIDVIDEENSKHQEKMLEIGQNLDQYRSSINSLTSKPAQSKENKDFQNAILHLEELKALLTEREGILYQERSTNEALKKEINRLRDEALIIQRRAALNIS